MNALVLPLLLADLLYLKGGQVPVEGRVEDDGKSAMVAVRRPDGSRISYPREQVDRVERCPLPEEVYAERRAALGERDARGLLDLALWAQAKGMRREPQEAFREVLRLEPGNAQALSALGFEQVKGIWMSADEAHIVQGDRLLRGRWLAPPDFRKAWTQSQLERAPKEKAAVLEAFRGAPGDLDAGSLVEGLKHRQANVREASVEGIVLARAASAVGDLVDLLVSPEGEALEAPVVKALQSMGERGTLDLLFKRGFRTKDEGGRTRMIRAVGELGDTRAAKTLVVLAIEGASWPIRQESAKALARLNHRPAFQGLCAVLQQGDAVQRGRSAEALQVWGSEEAVPYLIQALDLRRQEGDGTAPAPRPRTDVQIPGGGSVGIGSGGMSDAEALATLGLVDPAPAGITFDGPPPETIALEAITGQSLGRDAAKWSAWWEGRKK